MSLLCMNRRTINDIDINLFGIKIDPSLHEIGIRMIMGDAINDMIKAKGEQPSTALIIGYLTHHGYQSN